MRKGAMIVAQRTRPEAGYRMERVTNMKNLKMTAQIVGMLLIVG
jgi:hypothetical protein